MKGRTQFPTDLMMLLVAPILVITVVGLVAGYAMSFYHWLAAHH